MSRRGDPERLYQARRAGVTNQLVDQDRIPRDAVDGWLMAWEVHALAEGRDRLVGAFWDGAREWILEQRRRGPR